MLISNTGISKTGISNKELENGIIASSTIMPFAPSHKHPTNTSPPPQPPHPPIGFEKL